MLRFVPCTAAVTGLLYLCVLHAPARADTWDLNLGRLCQMKTQSGRTLDCGGGYDPSDPIAGNPIPDDAAFRSLMSELGVVFAPNILSPADTKGYSGFSLAAEFGFTMINPRKNSTDQRIEGGHRFWRAAESVSAAAFSSGNIRRDADGAQAQERIDRELPPGFAPTISLMARKGIWFPLPSFELGLGVRHLLGSRMWAPQATAKLALHEGFHGWPVPSLAVRGSGSRVIGTPGFNLTLAALDFSISKHVGIASTFNINPYVGYQLLWIIADSEVLDATPGVDAMSKTAGNVGNDTIQMSQCRDLDCNANFTFTDQSNITRHRVFFGLRANFYIVSLLFDYSYFVSGANADQIAARAGVPGLTIPDESGAQHAISFALALDY